MDIDHTLHPVDVPSTNNKTGKKKTVEDTYQKLSQLEHIILRPDTYIGSAEKITQNLWLWDDVRGCMVQREASFVPGLYKIFDEILVNAADHKQRDASMDTIEVNVDPENNRISVYNNGSGIPVEVHKKEGVYVPELIFGHLLTSSNYNDNEKKVVGGRNGYGAKLANIFSTEFVVETADQSTKRRYQQVFKKNMTEKVKPVIKEGGLKKNEQWTRISFRPDLERFGLTHLEADVVALMQKRVYDIAGCTPGVKVYLNGEKLPVRNFKDYVSLYYKDRQDVQIIHEKCGERWEVIVTPSDGQFQNVSFVNSIWTMKGGTHVAHVADQLAARIIENVTKKHKGLKVKPFQVKNHICLFIKCLIENPSFDSQTKENMTSRPPSFGSKCELGEELFKRVLKSEIIENLLTFAKFKQNTELKKTDGGKQRRVLGIPKLDDANLAGTKDSSQCTLILTEGDSAKSLAVSGFSVVGRDRYGVFPLRGKLLNVREASHKQIMENAEVNNLKKILGLQHGKSYDPTSVKTLRYGRVVIMTDQDHDGSHIKGLLINFFQHFWPSLMKLPHFLGEFVTPIVKCTKGRSEKVFFTMPEYRDWLRTIDGLRKGWKIKYYKGLGTSSAVEAKDYFSNLDRHLLEFKFSGDGDFDSIDLAFSKQKIQQRKEWLSAFEEGTFFDHRHDELNYTNFVNKELILFSIADNERSIPSMMDGLKPSQRKVLFACFKRKLRAEIKVAQLAGYVSEHAAYHHGEASLMATIINLAQNFLGSNNINLLYPAGQFGTRLQGGKDAASPRYIFTRLTALARLLYPVDDDAVLDYLEDDGMRIEPKFYAPVIPMVLVNGADGIGTGWSSSVPCYSPRTLIAAIRRLLASSSSSSVDGGDEQDGGDDLDWNEPEPWYRRFRGSIRRTGPTSFDVYGEVRRVDATTLVVTELPTKTWTTPYKEWLESVTVGNSNHAAAASSSEASTHTTGSSSAKDAPFLREVRDGSTENDVRFTLTLSEEEMRKTEDIGVHKRLRLASSLATSNLVLFDADRRLRRYENTKQILLEFYGVRLSLYEERRLFLLSVLKDEVTVLENKARFILLVVDGKLKVARRRKKDVVAELVRLRFRSIPKKKVPRSVAGGGTSAPDEDDEDDEDDAEDAERRSVEEDQAGFDYLLSMPLWSLTMERVEKLCADRDGKVREMEEMERTTPQQMYRRDLDRLEEGLDAWEAQEEEEALALHKAARDARKKQQRPTTQRKGAAGGRKVATLFDLSASQDAEDEGEVVPLPEVKMKAARGKALKSLATEELTSVPLPSLRTTKTTKTTTLKKKATTATAESSSTKASERSRCPAFFRSRQDSAEDDEEDQVVDVEPAQDDTIAHSDPSDSDEDFEMSLTQRLAQKMRLDGVSKSKASKEDGKKQPPAVKKGTVTTNTAAARRNGTSAEAEGEGSLSSSALTRTGMTAAPQQKRGRAPKKTTVATTTSTTVATTAISSATAISPYGKTPDAKRKKVTSRKPNARKPVRKVLVEDADEGDEFLSDGGSTESAGGASDNASIAVVSDEDDEDEDEDGGAKDPTPRKPPARTRRAPVSYRASQVIDLDDDEDDESDVVSDDDGSDFLDNDSE